MFVFSVLGKNELEVRNSWTLIFIIGRKMEMGGLWFTEKQTDHFGITMEIKQTLHTEQTEFQKLDMVETAEWGNMLLLDDMVMTSQKMSSSTMKWWHMFHCLLIQIQKTFLL